MDLPHEVEVPQGQRDVALGGQHPPAPDAQVTARRRAQIVGPGVDGQQDLGMGRIIRDPVNVDGVGRARATRAPDAGEHSEAILSELGYSDAEIAVLRDSQVI